MRWTKDVIIVVLFAINIVLLFDVNAAQKQTREANAALKGASDQLKIDTEAMGKAEDALHQLDDALTACRGGK